MTHIVRGSKKITDDLGHFRWVCSNILVSFDFISTVWPFFSFLFFSVPSSNHHVLHPRQLPWTETTWIGWNEVLLIDFCTLICFLEVFEHVLLPWLLKASSDFVSPSRTLHFGDTLGTIFVQDFCSLVVSLSLDAEFSCDIRLCSSWLSCLVLAGFQVWSLDKSIFCSIFCNLK